MWLKTRHKETLKNNTAFWNCDAHRRQLELLEVLFCIWVCDLLVHCCAIVFQQSRTKNGELIIRFIPLRAKQIGRYKFNLKKKSTHTHIWCQRICLSVAKFDLNYLRTSKIEWAEIFGRTSLWKSHVPKSEPRQKKFARLDDRAILICPILLVFAQKQPFLDK